VYNPRGGVDRPGKGNAHGLAQPRPDEPHHVPASSSAGSNILSTVMSKNRAIAIVLLAIGVIHPTFAVAALFAVGLLAIDLRALRIVSRMFDRERLVTGAKGHQGRSILSAWSIATTSGRLISRRRAGIRR